MSGSTPTSTQRPLAIIHMRGAAILRNHEAGTHKEQTRGAARIARSVMEVVREGYRVLVVPGNAPQMDRELQRQEEASNKLPPRPIGVCLADTSGTIGYRLASAIRNNLRNASMEIPVSSLNTLVLVSGDEASLERGQVTIGPPYTAWRARDLTRTRGWRMIEEKDGRWQHVVPRPRPVDIIDLESIERLLDAGHVVIAGAGGGIPMAVDQKGQLAGVGAVLDAGRVGAAATRCLQNHRGLRDHWHSWCWRALAAGPLRHPGAAAAR